MFFSILRFAFLPSLFLALAGFSAGCSTHPKPQASKSTGAAGAAEKTEILWDTWGVPHIFGADPEGLFYALGWAQMKNHGNLILRAYGRAQGRAAQYWGEAYFDSDRWVHVNDIPARGERWLERQTPEMKGYLAAFAEGMNAYGEAHPDRLAEELLQVLPVSAADVLAHVNHTVHFTFIVSARYVGRQIQDWKQMGGSNAWAIGPSRTASGNAMLLINPHLGWDDHRLWFEIQLTGPGVDFYGATLLGFPVPSLGFNDHLGWTHTTNRIDVQDVYRLELAEGGYRFDGEVRPFEATQRTIQVRQEDGSLRQETVPILRSVHGPVVWQQGSSAFALRVSGLEESGIVQQYWDMARATGFRSFEEALRRLQMPFYNTLYSDRDGHIFFLSGGRIPLRPAGEWSWDNVVPGTTSETLWTETHPYDDLPRVLDPPSGWLQNANEAPWTTTHPPQLVKNDYPRYMAVPQPGAHTRSQRSIKLLMADDDITFEELAEYKHSTYSELAARVIDDLLEAVRQPGTSDKARRAAKVLAAWDLRTDSDSRGAVLFIEFARAWFRNRPEDDESSWAIPYDPIKAPFDTPDGFYRPEVAVAALESASDQVLARHGTLDVPWGEVHRFQIADIDLPANGGPDFLGIFRAVGFAPLEDGRYFVDGGESFVAAVEFSDPVRARTLVSYGNASQPDSPHRTDQLYLLSEKKLKPVWRERAEIESNLESREEF